MLRSPVQLVNLLVHQPIIAAAGRFFQRQHGTIDFSAFFGWQRTGLRIGQRFRGGRQNGFGFCARFDRLPLCEILLGVFDRLFQHSLDFGIADAVTGLHFDGVLLAGA